MKTFTLSYAAPCVLQNVDARCFCRFHFCLACIMATKGPVEGQFWRRNARLRVFGGRSLSGVSELARDQTGAVVRLQNVNNETIVACLMRSFTARPRSRLKALPLACWADKHTHDVVLPCTRSSSTEAQSSSLAEDESLANWQNAER